VSFHLGEAVSTIDLNRTSLVREQIAEAEQVANEVVMSSRPVTARFVGESELAQMPLRTMPVVEGPIRVVQIAQFDWSPCGGTHVCDSGQVGMIKVTRVERRKTETRVHFVCGWRALFDYAGKQDVVHDLTTHFTTSEDEILSSVKRMEAEAKVLRKALTAAQMQLLDREVGEWIAQAEPIGQVRVVRRVFRDRDLAVIKEAARRLTRQSGMVALLAVRQPRAQFVFARSKDVAADMGSLMRAACATVGGRGGGRSHYAQGGAPESGSVDRALDEAANRLKVDC
jgi:alanyl-tRNA synthetase